MCPNSFYSLRNLYLWYNLKEKEQGLEIKLFSSGLSQIWLYYYYLYVKI